LICSPEQYTTRRTDLTASKMYFIVSLNSYGQNIFIELRLVMRTEIRIVSTFRLKRPLAMSNFKQICFMSGNYSEITLRDFMKSDQHFASYMRTGRLDTWTK
jgi:hypothetical protein